MKKTALIVTLLALVASAPMLSVASAEEEGSKVKIPETLSGVWQEVKSHEEQLGKTIADKKLESVHESAFAIRDLVSALPDKSKDLAPEKLTKLNADVKFVAALAGRLDESGDSKDQAGTEANFKKLQSLLDQIESLYPPESLKMDMKDMKM